MKKSEEKPTFALLPNNSFDTDSIVALFKELTGRDPSPEEIEEDRLEWEKENNR